MILAIFAALAAAQSLPAPEASGWEVIDTSEAGVASIQPASVTRSGAIARATVMVRMAHPRGDEAPLFVTRVRFDCGANTYAFEAGDTYNEAGGRTGSFAVPEDQIELQPIEPGGLEEIVQATACTHPEG